jgi:hypothetical protein
MRRLVICALLFLASCEQTELVGYVVYKEYTPKHMCHDNVTTQYEAGVIVVPYTNTNTHMHSEQPPIWSLYVGTKDGTTPVTVTESCYNSFKVTDKVRVFGNSVELIKKGCK